MAGAQKALQYDTQAGKEKGGRQEDDFHVCTLAANILEALYKIILPRIGLRRGDIGGYQLQRSEQESCQSFPGNWSCDHHPV